MIWTMAEDFGARCQRNISEETTHLVSANVRWMERLLTQAGTAKTEEAYRQGHISVVWAAWLNDSLCRWERQPELPYEIPRNTQMAKISQEELQGMLNTSSSAMNVSEAQPATFDMDWGEAEDEVEAFLEEDTESDAESSGDTPEASDNDTANDELLSPLSKRRRLAALRGGQSKLRHSVQAHEFEQEDDDVNNDDDDREVATSKRLRISDKLSSHGHSVDDALDDFAHEIELELGDE